MPLRTRLIRALDEEIPISPREFSVEARQASILIATWKREHPGEPVNETVVFETVRDVLGKYWGISSVAHWEAALHRVAHRMTDGADDLHQPRRGGRT
jgi:hypothetical protein